MTDERVIHALIIEVDRVVALGRSIEPTAWSEPSKCKGWSISDVFAHLANDFERFAEWIHESRAGELDPPFDPSGFAADNAARLERYAGLDGPFRVDSLERAARLWIMIAENAPDDEPQRHPRGTITVGRQVVWATGECAIHGWDVASALGIAWSPPGGGVERIVREWPVPVHESGDPWTALLVATGRSP